jgi:hypothetical protein
VRLQDRDRVHNLKIKGKAVELIRLKIYEREAEQGSNSPALGGEVEH